MNFSDRLSAAAREKRSVLCVGLDPDSERLPAALTGSKAERTVKFCSEIISATLNSAIAFKLNLAFFEALGLESWSVMERVLRDIPSNILRIADAKRGDIGNSARFYAQAILNDLPFDAITISPYMGSDSVTPFLEFENKAVFVLSRTSNPGGNDFQVLPTAGDVLYMRVAHQALSWAENKPGCVGFVAGATDIEALEKLRSIAPHAPLLVPGIGAQGGSPQAVVSVCGNGPLLVNSSRSILYASSGKDFAEAASRAAERTRKSLLPSKP